MSKGKAIVLGTSPETGVGKVKRHNIGDSVKSELLGHGWSVCASTCETSIGSRKFDVPDLGRNWQDSEALVVSLGMTDITPFDDVEPDRIQAVIDACLTLPLKVVNKYVRGRNIFGEGGHIILIGSYAHRHPFSNGTMYCAAKAGIEMAGKTLAWDLTPYGYKVNVVHPYHVAGTPMWENVQDGVMATKNMTREEADRYAEKDLRTTRLSNGRDVAAAVRELLESEVGYFKSGDSVELFGGTR